MRWKDVKLQEHFNFQLILHADNTKEDTVDEQEIDLFFMEFTGMLRLMQSELALMLGIVPLLHQKSVLSIILQDTLELVYHDAEVSTSLACRMLIV